MSYYIKNSEATTIDEIRIALIDIISNQLNQISDHKALLLWINETNCYVSCHFYDSKNDVSDESENYSVVEFDELLDLDEEETDETFYEKMYSVLKTIPSESFKNENIFNVDIFETDEMNEPTKIFEIKNGILKITELPEEDWSNDFIEEVENDEILSTKFKKKKLISWCIRTIIAVVLYLIFWKYEWVRWSLFVYIPINLFSLASIFLWRNLILKKLKKIKSEND
jgi:hypothetical protein